MRLWKRRQAPIPDSIVRARLALERSAASLPCCRPGDSWRAPVEAQHTRTGECLLRPMDGEATPVRSLRGQR